MAQDVGSVYIVDLACYAVLLSSQALREKVIEDWLEMCVRLRLGKKTTLRSRVYLQRPFESLDNLLRGRGVPFFECLLRLGWVVDGDVG